MSIRKLNYSRILFATGLALVPLIAILVGWGLSFIPAPEGFWIAEGWNIVLAYFVNGLGALVGLALITTILGFFVYASLRFTNWVYPEQEE